MKRAIVRKITLSGKSAKRLGSDSPVSFDFRPGVNLLVGPNGSGKSTVLRAVVSAGKKADDKIGVTLEYEPGTHLKFFDFEKNNPRLQSTLHDSAPMFQVASMFSSHGEVVRALVPGLLEPSVVEDCLLLLDEPDQALDHEGLDLLVDALKTCVAPQIVVACHAPRLLLDPAFHVIELRPGYVEAVRARLHNLLQETA